MEARKQTKKRKKLGKMRREKYMEEKVDDMETGKT